MKIEPRRATCAAVVVILVAAAGLPAGAATVLPERWTAGGLSAGIDSAGQAARIAADASGNVIVVSGPSGGSLLAVTSYTANGAFRWRATVAPSIGTFVGDWVAAAPNGDVVVIGHNQDSHGRPIASTILRYNSVGTLLWRVDSSAAFFPSVARLVIDAAGSAYIAWSAVGSGLFVVKYSPSGVLLWTRQDAATGSGYAVASSLALSPDGADVAVTGSISGGATWITAVYDATTGVRRWRVTAAEGTFARDVVVDDTRVYVAGQGVTGAGTPALKYFLTVIAYDRATGARLWRSDRKPADAYDAAGLWMAMAPDGSLVTTGQTNRGFLDWYTVAFETSGAVRWEAVRDGGLNTDEIPAGVLVLPDGTTVVTGRGGPNLPGGYIPGVTAGYSASGAPLWEAFSRMATVWSTALPNGDVCATGGYDALITCWRVSGGVTAAMYATPATGTAPLLVTFDGSGSTAPGGSVTSWAWAFGDGAVASGARASHLYGSPGTYTASLTVTDGGGASSIATSVIVVTPLAPAAPSGLVASQSGNLVVVTWLDNSSNETAFYIERCQGPGCTSFANLASQWPDVTSYTDYAAVGGSSYSYRARAYNGGGYSAYSNIASIQVGLGNQPPTALISAVPVSGAAPLSVAFTGSGSSDPDGTIAAWAWAFGDGTSGSGTQVTHLYSTAGAYVASLTVTDNGGASSTTSTSITVTSGTATGPAAPTGLAAISSVRRRVDLAWTNTAANATSITVERCSGSTCTGFVVIARLAATAKSWTDPWVRSGSTYRYRVSASNAAGSSPYSNIARATAR
jgi:PKD repeat protein